MARFYRSRRKTFRRRRGFKKQIRKEIDRYKATKTYEKHENLLGVGAYNETNADNRLKMKYDKTGYMLAKDADTAISIWRPAGKQLYDADYRWIQCIPLQNFMWIPKAEDQGGAQSAGIKNQYYRVGNIIKVKNAYFKFNVPSINLEAGMDAYMNYAIVKFNVDPNLIQVDNAIVETVPNLLKYFDNNQNNEFNINVEGNKWDNKRFTMLKKWRFKVGLDVNDHVGITKNASGADLDAGEQYVRPAVKQHTLYWKMKRSVLQVNDYDYGVLEDDLYGYAKFDSFKDTNFYFISWVSASTQSMCNYIEGTLLKYGGFLNAYYSTNFKMKFDYEKLNKIVVDYQIKYQEVS